LDVSPLVDTLGRLIDARGEENGNGMEERITERRSSTITGE
jgi:hypothetical protein